MCLLPLHCMWLLGTTSYQFTSLSTVLYAIFMACFYSRRLGMIILGKTYLYRFGCIRFSVHSPGLNVYICKLITKPVQACWIRLCASALQTNNVRASLDAKWSKCSRSWAISLICIFFLILFQWRAKLLEPDWPSGKTYSLLIGWARHFCI